MPPGFGSSGTTRVAVAMRVLRAHGEAGAHKASETQMLPPPHRREDTEKRSDLRAALAHFEHGVGEPLALLIFIP
jgi:hypothetical protein